MPSIRWVTLIALATLAGLLAGCASRYHSTPEERVERAEREAEVLVARYDRAIAELDACIGRAIDTFYRTPPGWRLMDIIITIDAGQAERADKMAIRRTATLQEKLDLLDSRASTAPCNAQALRDFAAFPPAYANLYIEILIETDAWVLQVLKDEITIGELNRRYDRQDSVYQQKWNLLQMEMRRGVKSAAVRQLERRETTALRQKLSALSLEIAWLELQLRALE